jgi:hypothetical protein
MRLPAALLALTLAAAAGGCHSCDKVESELRARESELLAARGELFHCQAANQSLELELKSLRGEGAASCPDGPVPVYPVKSLVLGRGTGGRNEDGCPGDEALEIHLQPNDSEGQPVRVAGIARVEAIEISPEGLKHPLSAWDVPADELKRSWRSGLLSTGYVLVLPWKQWPSTERVRVVAQLQLADGRVFEADKDVRVRVTPPDRRPAPAPAPPKPAPGPPKPADPPEEVLPAPRPLGPVIGAAVRSGPAQILRPVPLPPEPAPAQGAYKR